MKRKQLAICIALAFHAFPAAHAADAPFLDAATSGTTIGESNLTKGAQQIKASYAWRLPNASGKGVTVAIIDTGIDTHNDQFRGRILPGYNFYNRNTDVTDLNGHGTHVAGIIAAAQDGRGIQGIAYESSILPVRVFSPSGSALISTIFNGLAYTQGKARLVNMSLGWGQTNYGATEMSRAVNAGQLLVVAAGNSGRANPDWPARYAKENWAKGQIIAVGAVDSANRIASFSNRAGDAMNYFLVAPGVSVLSTYIGGYYAYMSGTSMATPHVTGAAAALMSYWPTLGSAQVADILFRTATDLGAAGTDPTYGRGLVNLEKALKPVGTTVVKTASGSSLVLSYSSFTVSSAYGAAVRSAASSGVFKVAGFDDYGRDFGYDLGTAIAPRAPLSVNNLFSAADTQLRYVESTSRNGQRFAMVSVAPSSDAMKLGLSGSDLEAAERNQLAAFSYTSATDGSKEWSMGAGGLAHNYFGLGDTPIARMSLAGNDALNSPYFALVPNHMFAAVGIALPGGDKLKIGALNGTSLMAFQGTGPSNASQLAVVEYEKAFDGGRLTLSSGYLSEDGALLGGTGTGGFELGGSSGTMFTEAAFAHQLADRTWFAARASYGYTSKPGAGGVIANVTPITSLAWGAGIVQEDSWVKGDRLSVALSQPMKARSGTMSVAASTGLDESGNVVMGYESFSLKPARTETDLQASYFSPLSTQDGVAATLLLRQHPGHEDGREAIAGMRYQLVF